FDDASLLTATANHKTGDVLQKDERNLFLIAGENKTGTFVSAVIIDHTAHLHLAFFTFYNLSLISHNANSPAIYPSISANDCLAIIFFELFKLRIINNPFNHDEHIIGFSIKRKNSIEFFSIFLRRL